MEELLELLKTCCPLVDFASETQLWSKRVIDSMDMVNIMSSLEDKYNISIEYCMLTPGNFDSAKSILALVQQLQHGEIK